MKKLSPVLIVLAGCLWGTMGLFVRHLNAMGLASMEIVECRSILAVLILFPCTALREPGLLRLRPKNLWPLIGSGICSIVFFNYCYFSTIALMDMSAAAILLYTSPIFVMLMSLVFFRERLTGKKLLALGLAFGGCCLVSGIGSGTASLSSWGLLLGLGSGFGYALYSIFSRVSLNQGLSSLTITNYTFFFAALGGGLFTDFSGVFRAFSQYGLRLLGLLVVYCIVTTVLPYLLYTAGLAQVENGTASVLASVEPVVATLLGLLVYREAPTVPALVGMVLVLGALILLSVSPTPKESISHEA